MEEKSMEKIISLAKRRGFIYPGSELYGGVANTYDYGPMGVELLRNIKNLWWEIFVHKRTDIVGLDASLISHHKIWEASGHTAGFADAMVDCKNCKARMRADHVIEDFLHKYEKKELGMFQTSKVLSEEDIVYAFKTKKVEGWSIEKLNAFIQACKDVTCPNCKAHNWTPVRKFNLLFPVYLGIVEGDQSLAYLRGETAQGMFINFHNVIDSTRVKLPFGIAQLGKSFRNEITPGNSVFRTLEFEQGEIEYFFNPETTNWEELFESWKLTMWEFITKRLGITEKNLRWRTHTNEERSFYSKRTEDLEYTFPFGFKEVWGLAYRTDYDLSQHANKSGKDLSMIDHTTGKKVKPHVIEPAVGINRLLLMVLVDAYTEEEKRIVLKIHPRLSRVIVAVFALLANKGELVQMAESVYKDLKEKITGFIMFDDRGNIGKRYLSQDEIGTPYCITIDFQSLEDKTVTIRDRNTTEQIRKPISELAIFLQEKITG
jgi:glycyl-tRNA synthetase